MDNINPRDEDSTDEEEEEDLINPNMKPYDQVQTVQFSGIEETNSFELNSRSVTIIPSSGEHETGSSKIKMKNVVDFNWEFKYYPGQLLAIHVSGKYLAYGIKTVGKMGGVVRVVSRESGNRTLLKKMVGMVQDIGFAHIADQVILASVDETGTLCVHRVEEKTYNTISCSILLQVEQGPQPLGGPCHRIFWCPYTPDDDDPGKRAPSDIDAGKLLCLTHGNRVRLVNVGIINERFGADPLSPTILEGAAGYLEITSHSQPVIDASFAPDGSAIATASQDGYVKFFQVDMYHKSPIRCLHEWKPHGDKPLSALVFVDNHKTFEPHPDVQFWKFLITGAENNSELKFWSCESWTCLQTIHFATPRHGQKKVMLKVGLDLGADYLLVSDIHSKLLYVLQLYKYPAPYQKVAYVRSVTEFLLPYPILSFAILDAGIRNFKSPSLEDLSNEEGEDDLGQYIQALVVRMYLVQPKSLQECNLAFQPPPLDNSQDDAGNQLDTITHDSMMFADGLSDLSGMVCSNDSMSHELPVKHELTLLGPNAFTSPGKDSPPVSLCSPQMSLQAAVDSQPPLLSRILDVPLGLRSSPDGPPVGADEPLATSDRYGRGEGFASGGSSPSREVQEIFSLNNSGHNSYYVEEKELTGVEAAVAKLHLMPTPPVDNVLFEVGPPANGVLQSAAGTESAWPPIPLALVNEARNSAGDSINAKRRSLGGDKSSVKVYLAPIKKTLTKEKLRDQIAFGGLTPKSIFINAEETIGSKGTWALLEYENQRDAEAAIRELHNKSPHHWVVKLARHTSPVSSRTEGNGITMVTPPDTPEQRPSITSRLDGMGCGDSTNNGANSNFEIIAESLNEKMVTLMQIVEQQNTTIKGLTNELSSLRRTSAERDKSHQKSLLSQIDKLLAKSRNEMAVQCQEYLATKSDVDRKKQEEAFLHANAQLVATSVANACSSRLPTMVQDEVQATVLPQLSKAILKIVEPMQIKLHQDLAHQLTSIDHQLKTHIAQLVQSKTITDILSQSAAIAMKPASQACFTEVYSQSIMPRFEKACNIMFKQVNDTFAKGTQEYIQTLDGHIKKQQQQYDKSQQIVSQLQTVSESVRASNEHVRTQMSAAVGQEVATHLQKGLGGVQENLAKCVRDNVREHLTKCFVRQQAAIENKVLEAVRCITPAPHIVDSQTQILQLIANEDINGAFQMALSAADLGLVVLVCEKVDPENLFSQFPCPLQQNVLLSLIQQLSADMANHSETKHKYLLEAVMNLDTRNSETRGHIPAVIQRLQQQLKEYMTTSSNPKMINKVKQLLFSTRALLNFNTT